MAAGKGKGQDADEAVNAIVKYMVFFFNFMFWLIGAFLIGLGTWAYIEKDMFYQKDAKDIYDIIFDISIIMIIVGSVIFMLAFFACTGALRENLTMLKIFVVTLTVIIVLELCCCILAFVFSDKVKTEIEDLIKDEGIIRYRDDPDFQSIVDWFQETFDCCGVGIDGYKDWSLNPYFECEDSNPSVERCGVPYSCCVHQNNLEEDYINTACGYGTQLLSVLEAKDVIFTDGCIDNVLERGRDSLLIVGGSVIGCILLQMVNLLLSIHIYKNVQAYEAYLESIGETRPSFIETFEDKFKSDSDEVDSRPPPSQPINGYRNGYRNPAQNGYHNKRYKPPVVNINLRKDVFDETKPVAVRAGLVNFPNDKPYKPRYETRNQEKRVATNNAYRINESTYSQHM